jgi:hypothetical protein
MKRQTFEQAMRLSLGNLNITRVIDDELPVEFWQMAYLSDQKNIDKFVNVFCEDMAFLSNRPIKRESCLEAQFNLFHPRIRMPMDIFATVIKKDYYGKTLKAIDRYINNIIDGMQCLKTSDITIKPFPFSKIKRSNKKFISAYFPLATDNITQVTLNDPTPKSIEEVKDKPRHILNMLDKLDRTQYDYQPYILDDGTHKLLIIRLGNDWNDIAIAQWEPLPKIRVDNGLLAVAMVFIMGGILGFWYNGFALTQITEILLLVLSILSSAISAVLAGIFVVRNNKSFKV